MFGPCGAFLRKWNAGSGNGAPWDVLVRGNEVLVADSKNYMVQLFLLDGTLVRRWRLYDIQRHTNAYYDYFSLALTKRGQVIMSNDKYLHVFE